MPRLRLHITNVTYLLQFLLHQGLTNLTTFRTPSHKIRHPFYLAPVYLLHSQWISLKSLCHLFPVSNHSWTWLWEALHHGRSAVATVARWVKVPTQMETLFSVMCACYGLMWSAWIWFLQFLKTSRMVPSGCALCVTRNCVFFCDVLTQVITTCTHICTDLDNL